MTIKLTSTTRDDDPLPLTREVEQVLLSLLASREVRVIRTQEEAAIGAEDYWTQAEEACAVDPIG